MSRPGSNRGQRKEGRKGRQERLEAAATTRVVANEAEAATKKTASIVKTVKGTTTVRLRKLVVNESPDQADLPKRKAFRISLRDILKSANGNGHVNALHTQKKGIRMSMSTHVAFRHKIFGEIIPVIIQKSTVPHRRQAAKRLDSDDVGSWVKANVMDWEKGIWFHRIGHTNIVSDRPLNVNKDIVGHTLISSKIVEQEGREKQYFPHIIVLGAHEKVKPAFKLVINDLQGEEDVPGMVHIGPTVGALRDNKEIEEYLHLEPCE